MNKYHWVNDIHSQVNRTLVAAVVTIKSQADVRKALQRAKREGRCLSVTGGRHAMGGQQFGTDTILLDMSGMNRVLHFDRKKGLVTAEAGIQWPDLVNYLLRTQKGQSAAWGIRQKQTGADRLSLGGALAANVHGRGLTMKPMIDDVDSFTLMTAAGKHLTCSRRQNLDLFKLVIGGYGLFGIVTTVTLRLGRRSKIERVVEIIPIESLLAKIKARVQHGYVYGDFQYSIDPRDKQYLTRGVFSCYRPIRDDRPVPDVQMELAAKDWDNLYYLAHADKKRAWDTYSGYYMATTGQLYWSDLHQMSVYNDDYHKGLDKRLGLREKSNELISEIYVPRSKLVAFMKKTARLFKKNKTDVIYGTIRFIEKDNESFLAWAKEPYACIIFNLHFANTPAGLERVARQFRDLIDLAIQFNGSYYLTYHHFARRDQVDACYPQLKAFLKRKLVYDPGELFQSNWYRHYRAMYGMSHATH